MKTILTRIVTFCELMTGISNEDGNFSLNIVFSDEAIFISNRIVNRRDL